MKIYETAIPTEILQHGSCGCKKSTGGSASILTVLPEDFFQRGSFSTLCIGKFALFCDSYLESNRAKNSAGHCMLRVSKSCCRVKWKERTGSTNISSLDRTVNAATNCTENRWLERIIILFVFLSLGTI
ncbi:unnamed protein product [Urochloa humidicola]